ncbi:hypothetical protein [Lysinibacillus sp. 54212]
MNERAILMEISLIKVRMIIKEEISLEQKGQFRSKISKDPPELDKD